MKAKIDLFKKLVETASQEELQCMSSFLQQQISHQGTSPAGREKAVHPAARYASKNIKRR